jgi:hypothetical protein
MDPADGILRVDFGDGVSAAERVIRTAIFVIDGAIARLVTMGFDRAKDRINIVQSDDVFPMWVECRGRRLYEARLVHHPEDGTIGVVGEWLEEPKRRGFFARLFRR